jgi:predicted PurR-regulated permease PerM
MVEVVISTDDVIGLELTGLDVMVLLAMLVLLATLLPLVGSSSSEQ